ncbi:MAG: iron ABC transporter permease [Thermotogae bacterium]|nr:iron ABC transporter permease [Thermotogota bacterium]
MSRKVWTILSVLLAAAAFEMVAGRVGMSPHILTLRLLRLALGLTAGLVLGSTGAALQRVYNNPLADGYILGISGGAILGVALAELLGIPSYDFLWALAGSAVVGILLISVSPRVGRLMIPVVGIGLGMFFSSIAILLFMMAGVEASRTFYALWGTLGRFYGYGELPLLGAVVLLSVVGVGYLSRFHRDMDAVSLGEVEALALGYDPKRTVVLVTVVSAVLVALITALVGVIGFVGIMAAHILRGVGVREGRSFYVLSGVVGAILILLSDALGRLLLGIDPPVGVVMSIVGAPFFVYLAAGGRV